MMDLSDIDAVLSAAVAKTDERKPAPAPSVRTEEAGPPDLKSELGAAVTRSIEEVLRNRGLI